MTSLDNTHQIHQDIVPAWLRTLECDFLHEDQKTWRGEFYLRGKIRRFSADNEVIDLSLKREVSDTPVLVDTQTHAVSTRVKSDVLTVTGLALMKPGVPLAVAQCLYRGDIQSEEVIKQVERLVGLIAGLTTPLKAFLTAMFSNADIAESFVACPARDPLKQVQ